MTATQAVMQDVSAAYPGNLSTELFCCCFYGLLWGLISWGSISYAPQTAPMCPSLMTGRRQMHHPGGAFSFSIGFEICGLVARVLFVGEGVADSSEFQLILYVIVGTEREHCTVITVHSLRRGSVVLPVITVYNYMWLAYGRGISITVARHTATRFKVA